MVVLVLAPPVVGHNQYCQLYQPQCLLGRSYLRYLFAVGTVSAQALLAKTVSWITVIAAVAFGLRHYYPRLVELGLFVHLVTIENDSQYQTFSSSLRSASATNDNSGTTATPVSRFLARLLQRGLDLLRNY